MFILNEPSPPKATERNPSGASAFHKRELCTLIFVPLARQHLAQVIHMIMTISSLSGFFPLHY